MKGDLYKIAVDYEYNCERFDRSLRGHLNKWNEYIPYDASNNASKQAFIIIKNYNIQFSELRHSLNVVQGLSFEELQEEYNKYFPNINLKVM